MKPEKICICDVDKRVCAEYHSVFSHVFCKVSKELLLQLNSPGDYVDNSSEQLEELLSKVTLKGYAAKKLDTVCSI